MAIDLARLSIEVDTTDLARGEAAMNKLAATGSKVEAATQKAGAGMARAGNQAKVMGAQVQGARMQTANITAQFNDIGVMMASGQSPFMLAMQQGTQLNQVFAQMGSGREVLRGLAAGFTSMINPLSLATIGIIAGGAALFQFGMRAFGASEEAQKLAESLKEIEENAAAAADRLRTARMGVSADELQVIDAIAAKHAEIAEAVAAMERASGRNARSKEYQLDLLQSELGKLEDQLKTIRESQEKAALMRDGMSEAAIEAAKLAGIDVASGIDAAARSAAELAAQLGVAFEVASAIKLERESLAAQYAQYGQGQQAARERMAEQRYSVDGRLPSVRAPQQASSGGGGGGRSDAQRQFEASQREAARLLDAARTAAEKYADEISRVNELQREGHLTATDTQKIIEQITAQYESATEAANGWAQAGEDIASSFKDAIVNGRDLADVMGSVRQSILSAALAALESNLFGKGGLGGFFSGIFGGFRAEGGPVSAGKAYVVGERGPEMFVPRGSGSIVPNGAGGGQVVVQVAPSPYFDVRVEQVSGSVAAEVVGANNEAMSERQRAASWG